MAEKISVLVADDHQLIRDGLRRLLQSTEDLRCVGEAERGDEAVTLAGELQPDVILMDIQMPGLNGIDATRQIVQHSPHIAVLMLTMFEDDHSVFSAMRAGARGYVLKGAKREEIERAVRAVGNGESIFSPAIATRMMQFFARLRPPKPVDVFPELTDREREVLDLIAAGYRNPQIAEALVISPKTVRNHVSNILSKLQAVDRTEVILKARAVGLGNQDG